MLGRRTLLLILVVLALLLIYQISLFRESTTVKPVLEKQAVVNPVNIYANANVGMFAEIAKQALPRVYVPNSLSNTVSVIDPRTYRVVDTFPTGRMPQHVVPSYDLKTLWVLNNKGNTVTPINPNTGKPGKRLPVLDPYNLYFTPDGRFAIVVDEKLRRLDFRDPQTMKLNSITPVGCRGVNHMDFTVDGKYAIATCEYDGQLLKLDVASQKILGYLKLNTHSPMKSMPQDIRLCPDGKLFYVADMMANGVFVIDPNTFTQIEFIPTGIGTHSIYPSRDGRFLYVANRGCMKIYCPPRGPGNISVIDINTRKVIATWAIPGGGSPDMGNVSADGKELWLSGRYDSEVYVFNTEKGELTHRIPVGRGPHGLTVWPQPGQYSLGHTGNMR